MSLLARCSFSRFVLALFALNALQAQPQAPLAFDVAVIKVSPFEGKGSIGVGIVNGRLVAQHVSLLDLVCFAYELEAFQVSGGPSWVHSDDLFGKDRYDVTGASTGEPAPSSEQIRQMLQTLFKDRFRLSTHPGTKDVPAYVLTQSEGGAKLKNSAAAPGQPKAGWSSGRLESKYEASAASMKDLIAVLRTAAGRLVVDRTGLAGTYAFTLQYATGDAPDPSVTVPSIFTAVKEQLGLKLESQVVPLPALIIDKVERPSEN